MYKCAYCFIFLHIGAHALHLSKARHTSTTHHSNHTPTLLAPPKTGTSLFGLQLYMAMYYTACTESSTTPKCEFYTNNATRTGNNHIKSSSMMNKLDSNLIDAIDTKALLQESTAHHFAWTHQPIFTHGWYEGWLTENVSEEQSFKKSLAVFEDLFSDPNKKYKVLTIERNIQDTIKSAKSYFGEQRVSETRYSRYLQGYWAAMKEIKETHGAKGNVDVFVANYNDMNDVDLCDAQLAKAATHIEVQMSSAAIHRACVETNRKTISRSAREQLRIVFHFFEKTLRVAMPGRTHKVQVPKADLTALDDLI